MTDAGRLSLDKQHMKLPVCLVNRRFEKIQEQVQGYESDV